MGINNLPRHSLAFANKWMLNLLKIVIAFSSAQLCYASMIAVI